MNRGWTLIGLVTFTLTLCAGCASSGRGPATQPRAELDSPAPAEPLPLATAPAPGSYPVNAFIADPTGRVVTRVWPVSVANYPNGSTVAAPVYFETADAAMPYPDWEVGVFQYGLYFWNLLASPVNMAINPPWKDVAYKGGAEQQAPVPGSEQDPVQPKLR